MLPCNYACRSTDHTVSRRGFLGAALGSTAALGLNGFANPASAAELKKSQKRVLVIFLAGGVSQLETWDPKPNTDTGGPFKAIQTSVTGTRISELLPHTAKHAHRLALVRSLNSISDDHGIGESIMLTGRKPEAGINYPHIGAVSAKMLAARESSLPGHIQILPKGGSGFNGGDATFLGPKFASVSLGDGKPPADLFRPANLPAGTDEEREAFRRKLNDRFAKSRKSAATEAYTESYTQAERVVKQAEVFDVEKENPKLADRYGRHDFGRHLLLARRLLEAGVTYVKVSHSNYDTHHENFDFHIEQLGEFDRPFAALLDDLADRGMLESTLVVVMSEMGRTPRINAQYGRDHWSKAWSVALAGAGIKGGVVVGKTNANGTAVADREVYSGHLFHTYLRAVGLDSTKNFYPNERPVPVADPKTSAIEEVLA
ncbi:hypothetical protein : Uncharacterized protein OS=Singulisphaera acidiphila (strain ATCC BAA-1392 / DSM 18658 / VKM B-2454 / MOB10) GN=Sinac_0041 PE=4 SV=1: DUF1501 [Gemmata massiliana]|uniref:DUF1501 domain-containing protein n=1 Tax=Gemmata massiliana TaxID=1210884 RepID=A0A6P2CTF1_9BACT|nr:DUF1501 domain-containing protein [Gemmata massiliana]VTR91415.1 hypothetical protein : Uncharacterized protein OS=Singulisphaera acidiphila (strain ATCC BAA-1392 / DSM 18658 / VKM B-2454 / MOB10) GN=Sinac_0041 PE=4 SV=1: DUF1501 [Gemmata massiliana]